MIVELHAQIDVVQRNLGIAADAGLPYEAALHRARLEDLMEVASRHGIDVTSWVDSSLLVPPTQTEG